MRYPCSNFCKVALISCSDSDSDPETDSDADVVAVVVGADVGVVDAEAATVVDSLGAACECVVDC